MNYDKVNKKIASLSTQVRVLQETNSKLSFALNGMMHEVRRFSNEISALSEEMSKGLDSPNSTERIREIAQTILHISGILSSRIGFTDIELNPNAINLQIKLRTNWYKKFDKARYILLNKAKTKRLLINFQGNSVMEMDAFQALELVPFVILDNAIKYSPQGRNILVNFNESPHDLEVTITSCGPKVEDTELEKIFDKGFRGKNGINASAAGEGLGLYLAKTLCEMHSISIRAKSEKTSEFQLSGIDYSNFSIILKIHRP